MSFLDQLRAVWPLIITAPWGFVPLALAILLAGWLAGRFMFAERIATLKERIESYKEKLGGATPDQAQKRIADLEQQLDDVRDKRRLTSDQLKRMGDALSGRQGKVEVMLGGAEGAGVYGQVRRHFSQLGWIVHSGGMAFPTPSKYGLRIYMPKEPNDDDRTVLAAIEAAGLKCETLSEKPDAPERIRLIFTDTDD